MEQTFGQTAKSLSITPRSPNTEQNVQESMDSSAVHNGVNGLAAHPQVLAYLCRSHRPLVRSRAYACRYDLPVR